MVLIRARARARTLIHRACFVPAVAVTAAAQQLTHQHRLGLQLHCKRARDQQLARRGTRPSALPSITEIPRHSAQVCRLAHGKAAERVGGSEHPPPPRLAPQRLSAGRDRGRRAQEGACSPKSAAYTYTPSCCRCCCRCCWWWWWSS